MTATLPVNIRHDDRRPIAALHIADHESRSALNPSGWFQNKEIDVKAEAASGAFKQRFMDWADGAMGVMRDMDAQGGIIWEPEGGLLPTYLGCPESAEALNPEMRGIHRPFIKRFIDAGFWMGACVRAEELVIDAIDIQKSHHVYPADPLEVLRRKIAWIHRYWGCRAVYVDSNMDASGQLLPATVFARLRRQFPDTLIIPEQWDRNYPRDSAVYLASENGMYGLPPEVRADMPTAFGVININRGDVAGNFEALVESVRGGCILLADGWHPNPAVKNVKRIMAAVAE